MPFLYQCNRCPRADVPYQDWLPIVPGVHWCRDCVTAHFDELPSSEKGRARRWRDNVWENWPPAKRAGIFNRMARWLKLR